MRKFSHWFRFIKLLCSCHHSNNHKKISIDLRVCSFRRWSESNCQNIFFRLFIMPWERIKKKKVFFSLLINFYVWLHMELIMNVSNLYFRFHGFIIKSLIWHYIRKDRRACVPIRSWTLRLIDSFEVSQLYITLQ